MTDKAATPVTEAANDGLDMFAEFALDEKAMIEGKWFEYKNGVEFLIARDGTTRHRRALLKHFKEFPPEVMPENPTDEQLAKSDAGVAEASAVAGADAVLLGWRGNLRMGKTAMPYSRENAIKLLRMTEFRNWVYGIAASRERFQAQLDAIEEKN